MYEYVYKYKIDKVNAQILELLAIRPRRLTELQHTIGTLSLAAVRYRLLKMEAERLIIADRIPDTSTTYRLAEAPENENKEGELSDSPKMGGNNANSITQ